MSADRGDPARMPAALAEALAADAPGALEEAWRAYGGLVRRVATRVLGRGAAGIADVEQATFLTLWQRRQALRSHPSLAGWCHATAWRIATDLARQERRRQRREEAVMSDDAGSPTPAADGVDATTAAALDAAIARLPAASQAAIIGVYLAGEDRAAMATRLGISEVTLRQRLSDGLARLRRQLRPPLLPEATLVALLQCSPPSAAPPVPVWIHDPSAVLQGLPRAQRRLLPQRRPAMAPAVLGLLVAMGVLAWWGMARAMPSSRAVVVSHARQTSLPAVGAAPSAAPAIPAGPPVMRGSAQQAQPAGGRVVLWSRSRWGNYPLATYNFRTGLRGDHPSVANAVQLVFGNRIRSHAWTGARVDGVPGTSGAGACGQDGGPAPVEVDEFRAGLEGNDRAAIRDLGPVAFAQVRVATPIGFDEQYAPVIVGHTYLVQYQADGEPGAQVKIHVLAHRDNDAVLLEWAPLPLPAHPPQGLD